jgi:hypothetical protein
MAAQSAAPFNRPGPEDDADGMGGPSIDFILEILMEVNIFF